jgi:hypothetical protein
MNMRSAIICERLRARSGWHGSLVTEDELRATEESLGLRLPEMLRTVYLEVGEWYLASIHGFIVGDENYTPGTLRESGAPHTGWRLPTRVVEALRRHPGSYVVCGEDGVPEEGPDGFIPLTLGGAGFIAVILDGHTGQVYLWDPERDYPGDRICLSFAAPSVEDWLEGVLDCAWPGRYDPKTKLATILAAEGQSLAELMAETSTSPPDAICDPSEARRVAQLETSRLREENLSDTGPLANRIKESGGTPLRYAGLEIEKARHSVLRQLYALLDAWEAKRERTQNVAARSDFSTAQTQFLDGMRPLIVADAELSSVSRTIVSGTSGLTAAFW